MLYPQLCQGAGVHEPGVAGAAALLLDRGPHVRGPRHLAQRQAVHPGQLVTHRRVSYIYHYGEITMKMTMTPLASRYI